MDDKKKAEIERQAREILDKFGKSISKVKIKEKKVAVGLGGFRNEGSGVKGSEDFKNRIFGNAKKKEGDYILAEVKKW